MLDYRGAVETIALNDRPMVINFEKIMGLTSVELVAEIYKTTVENVAEDILKIRATLNLTRKKRV